MAAIEISVDEERGFWALSLYSREIFPLELYGILRQNGLQATSRTLAQMIVSRKCDRARKARRTQCDSGFPNVDDCWTTVRIIGFVQNERLTADQIYQSIFGSSNLMRWMKKTDGDGLRTASYEGGSERRRSGGQGKDGGGVSEQERKQLEGLIKNWCQENSSWTEARDRVGQCAAQLTHKELCALAVDLRVLGGHWTTYFNLEQAKTSLKAIDIAWRRVLSGLLFGMLEESSANCVSFKRTPDGCTISVFTPLTRAVKEMDCEADIEVFKLEKQIRLSGVLRRLKFKPDIYSACDIMHTNQDTLRPTIYASAYEEEKKGSWISTHYTPNHCPPVAFPSDSSCWWNYYRKCLQHRRIYFAMDKNFLNKLCGAIR